MTAVVPHALTEEERLEALEAARWYVTGVVSELAEAVGVPQANIAFWEFSEKPPRSDVLPRLATVLGVSVEVLLTPSAAPPKPASAGPRAASCAPSKCRFSEGRDPGLRKFSKPFPPPG